MTDKPKPWTRSKLRKIDVAVGNRVREGRGMRGMSQEALGDALGISFQQVQKYEKGMNRISASRLVQIAAVLQLAPATFLAGVE